MKKTISKKFKNDKTTISISLNTYRRLDSIKDKNSLSSMDSTINHILKNGVNKPLQSKKKNKKSK